MSETKVSSSHNILSKIIRYHVTTYRFKSLLNVELKEILDDSMEVKDIIRQSYPENLEDDDEEEVDEWIENVHYSYTLQKNTIRSYLLGIYQDRNEVEIFNEAIQDLDTPLRSIFSDDTKEQGVIDVYSELNALLKPVAMSVAQSLICTYFNQENPDPVSEDLDHLTMSVYEGFGTVMDAASKIDWLDIANRLVKALGEPDYDESEFLMMPYIKGDYAEYTMVRSVAYYWAIHYMMISALSESVRDKYRKDMLEHIVAFNKNYIDYTGEIIPDIYSGEIVSDSDIMARVMAIKPNFYY